MQSTQAKGEAEIQREKAMRSHSIDTFVTDRDHQVSDEAPSKQYLIQSSRRSRRNSNWNYETVKVDFQDLLWIQEIPRLFTRIKLVNKFQTPLNHIFKNMLSCFIKTNFDCTVNGNLLSGERRELGSTQNPTNAWKNSTSS